MNEKNIAVKKGGQKNFARFVGSVAIEILITLRSRSVNDLFHRRLHRVAARVRASAAWVSKAVTVCDRRVESVGVSSMKIA